MTRDARLEQIDAIYRQLPTLHCQGHCQGACGVTPMSSLEHDRLQAATLHAPAFTPSRACIYLTTHGCKVYSLRPLICRLYGLVDTLKCPFGCVPDRYLTHDEGQALIAHVNALSYGISVMPQQAS